MEIPLVGAGKPLSEAEKDFLLGMQLRRATTIKPDTWTTKSDNFKDGWAALNFRLEYPDEAPTSIEGKFWAEAAEAAWEYALTTSVSSDCIFALRSAQLADYMVAKLKGHIENDDTALVSLLAMSLPGFVCK